MHSLRATFVLPYRPSLAGRIAPVAALRRAAGKHQRARRQLAASWSSTEFNVAVRNDAICMARVCISGMEDFSVFSRQPFRHERVISTQEFQLRQDAMSAALMEEQS
jgi:hypothetical protein